MRAPDHVPTGWCSSTNCPQCQRQVVRRELEDIVLMALAEPSH
jgi:hypothetical protein